jgi:hypothetical protein
MLLSTIQDGVLDLYEVVRLLREVYLVPDLVRRQVVVRFQDLRSRIASAERVVDLE